MESEQAVDYCRSLPGSTDGYPFGPEALVFKVGGKMYATLGDEPSSSGEGRSYRMNLKCDPGRAELLRQQYVDVTPGYHMNKRHWNTVLLAGDVPEDEILELIDHSYELVLDGLPKRLREELVAQS